ncbi:hypothetical protein V6N13_020791 [Hibiscus sabdariffa]|uniref:Uncharacterized protein n=1 Tax=Hibiscus sabdariffa TaxID=183260 RepID=A0ABR1Z7Y8_9ROSI
MKRIKTTGENEDAATFAIWDCGSPLYDSYELASLSHLIDRHLMKLPFRDDPKTLTAGISSPSDVTPPTVAHPTSKSIAKESSSLMSSFEELRHGKFPKRRWFGQRRNKAIKLRSGFSCLCNK